MNQYPNDRIPDVNEYSNDTSTNSSIIRVVPGRGAVSSVADDVNNNTTTTTTTSSSSSSSSRRMSDSPTRNNDDNGEANDTVVF